MTTTTTVAGSGRAREVVVAARRLLEEEGASALTMRRLAERLGIRAPSLYKHVPDKAALEAAIIATGLEDAAATLEAAVSTTVDPDPGPDPNPDPGSSPGRDPDPGPDPDPASGPGPYPYPDPHPGSDPLAALAGAYRRFALGHPHLYRLMHTGPLPRHRLPPGLEDRAAAPLLRVAGSRARARALWAFAHGMVMLELDHRFPPDADLDAAWQAGLTAFRGG